MIPVHVALFVAKVKALGKIIVPALAQRRVHVETRVIAEEVSTSGLLRNDNEPEVFMFNHDGWMWGGGMWLGWIVLIVLILVVIKFLLGSTSASRNDEDALSILKKRYARGEMDDEEFERRRKQLER